MTAGQAVGEGASAGPARAAGRHRRGAGAAAVAADADHRLRARRCSTSRFGLADSRPAALVDLPRSPATTSTRPQRRRPVRPGLRRRPAGRGARDPQPRPHRLRQGRDPLVAARLRQDVVDRPRTPTPRNLLGFKDGTRNIAGTDDAPRWTEYVWVARGADGRGLDGRRLVPGRPADPDAHRDLGPHLAGGAGGRSRPHQGRGRPARQGPGARRPFLKAIPAPHVRLAHPSQHGGARLLAAASPSPTAPTASAAWTRACSSSPTSATCAGFIPCSRPARNDALNEYIQHVGSALFAVPPGVGADGWWGETLLG